MFFCLRIGFFPFLSILLLSSAFAQSERPMQLNGVLYEVMPGADDSPQQRLLWSLELEELSRSYNLIESSVQRKRVNVLFFSDMSGRNWRKYWGERMRVVYSDRPEMVNDHAEGFFSITGAFPETFKAGDEFSLIAAQDGATRAYLNNKLVAQSLKPGHFEFWLRAWNTLAPMPDTFRGNLLAGGFIPDDLLAAYLNSELPRPVREPPGTDSQGDQGLSEEIVELVNLDDSAAVNIESVTSQGVVPVVLNNGNEILGL